MYTTIYIYVHIVCNYKLCALFMYCDLYIFPPDSNLIQVRLKQGHASLNKIMLVIVLYCSSLLLRYLSTTFPSFPRRFGPVRAFVCRWHPILLKLACPCFNRTWIKLESGEKIKRSQYINITHLNYFVTSVSSGCCKDYSINKLIYTVCFFDVCWWCICC